MVDRKEFKKRLEESGRTEDEIKEYLELGKDLELLCKLKGKPFDYSIIPLDEVIIEQLPEGLKI